MSRSIALADDLAQSVRALVRIRVGQLKLAKICPVSSRTGVPTNLDL